MHVTFRVSIIVISTKYVIRKTNNNLNRLQIHTYATIVSCYIVVEVMFIAYNKQLTLLDERWLCDNTFIK